ncbi:MAG: prolipoprotein diacylglyceryl transferase [Lachnospiraceae bacterium]|nr:prolipoprotein diacylglyceryl transferase [Lachnospiraceae bacterium]
MFWGNDTTISFPKLGIYLKDVPRGFTVFGYNIAFYGLIIGIGMICGILIARSQAKRTGQNPDFYLDFAIAAIPLGVIGARIYSVIFEWEKYTDDFWSIFNLRQGGLAIYGGVIAALLTVFFFCRIKKFSYGLFADTGIHGLILGQIIGRWGNFFNRECFGGFTDSFMAMRIDVTDRSLASVFKPGIVSNEMLANMYEGKEKALAGIMEIRDNIVTAADGHQYIQVQPTFLYESLWNLLLLIIMLIYLPKKKFNGEIVLIYLAGYGLGRFFIEGVRTDQLFIWNTGIAASQALSLLLFIAAVILIIVFRIRAAKGKIAVFDYVTFFKAYDEKHKTSKKGKNSVTRVAEVVGDIAEAERAEEEKLAEKEKSEEEKPVGKENPSEEEKTEEKEKPEKEEKTTEREKTL